MKKKAELKDVISQNLNDESFKRFLSEVNINEINSIYKILDIKLSQIYPNPNQPRQYFNEEKILELADSIKTYGLFTPIMVKQTDIGYMIIAGERRYKASKLAGLSTIKCIVCNLSNKAVEEISLIENIQRENLNVIEEAEAYASLIKKYGYTHEQLSSRVGKSREHISNSLRLIKLPDEIKKEVITGKLSSGHARTLLSLNSKEEMINIMQDILNNNFSVRKTEQVVKDFSGKNTAPVSLYKKEEKMLEEIIGKKVKISKTNISIRFNSENELYEIIKMLSKHKKEESI